MPRSAVPGRAWPGLAVPVPVLVPCRAARLANYISSPFPVRSRSSSSSYFGMTVPDLSRASIRHATIQAQLLRSRELQLATMMIQHACMERDESESRKPREKLKIKSVVMGIGQNRHANYKSNGQNKLLMTFLEMTVFCSSSKLKRVMKCVP